MIIGALDMKTKTVRNCLTPLDKVFMLNIDDKMNRDTLNLVIKIEIIFF